MPLSLLGAFGEPAIVVDDEARVTGINSAAAEFLALAPGGAVGTPCYEMIRARDATTTLPCYATCPVTKRNGVGWIEIRRLFGIGAHAGNVRCILLRSSIQGDPATLVFLESDARLSRTDAALAAEITERTLPALLSIDSPTDAALVVLGSALRLTAGDAGEVRFTDKPNGPLTRGVSIGDVEAAKSRSGDGDHAQAADELSLQAGRLIISAGRLRRSPSPGDGVCWALTAPVHCDSVLAGAVTVVGRPPAFSISMAARVLGALAGHLGLFLRWLPRNRDAVRMRVRTLGGFSAELDGRAIGAGAFRRKTGLDVLKLLVGTDGYSLSRANLAATLWPDASPGRAAANLRAVLHSLRRDLEPDLTVRDRSSFLFSDRYRVSLNETQTWVDVHEFVRARARFLDLARLGYGQEAIRAGQHALDLYCGPFLGDDCRDDWSAAERARLHELFVDLTLRVGRVLTAAEESSAAEQAYRRALAVDPAREELHAALIKLLVEMGRSLDAREQLRTCIRAVRTVLGVDPCPKTLSLVRGAIPRRQRTAV